MHTYRQGTQLGALQDQVDLFMRQLEVLARRDLELNQADVIMAGDDARACPGSQHALDARRALFRVVAAAQLKIDIAAGDRL